MSFSIRPFRRFPVHCAVTYHAGPFQGQGMIWNLSCTGWRLSGDLPMRLGETLSLARRSRFQASQMLVLRRPFPSDDSISQ